MDKHLLADNPMRPSKGGLCIIRTIQPIAIYEVVEGWKEFNEKHKNYTFRNSDGLEEHYTLKTHHFFSTDIDTVDESIVFKFMDDAWHWYMAYMKWEDDRIDNL